MSESQLQKLLNDKETFESELKALSEAAKPEEVCAQILAKITSNQDPLLSQDNEWAQPINPGGCCIVM